VIVRPEFRRQGIARALAVETANFAHQAGVRRLTIKVFAQNEDGIRLWEALGFEPRMLQMTIAVDDLLGDVGPNQA
jgi:ribosomal protein S18 acetylase RimI-like enzyme